MINDFVELVVDRFMTVNTISVDIRCNGSYNRYPFIDININHTCSCCVYFYDEFMMSCIYHEQIRIDIHYDEFTCVDEFVGQILSKIFYYDK